MEICNIHMFIYAVWTYEYETFPWLFPKVYALEFSLFTYYISSLLKTCLVMEIWFKVLEKSWNPIGQHVYERYIILGYATRYRLIFWM